MTHCEFLVRQEIIVVKARPQIDFIMSLSIETLTSMNFLAEIKIHFQLVCSSSE